ncbi:MAG: hypothetical protein IAI50_00015 [Candidatus Eremiobacteraeota bacterium]|nr:hypothetical protein [Candidatus Eremiobacteraeota bacterium]
MVFVLVLTGCGLIDGPTTFKLATPAAMAADGDAILFKAPTESDKCPLWSGSISFAAISEQGAKNASVSVSFLRSATKPRNDVMALTTEAGTLSIDGQQDFALTPGGARTVWHSLRSLSTTGERLRDKSGAELSLVRRSSGHFIVEATRAGDRDIFKGTVMPIDGKIYVRQAVFSSLVPSYSGTSQHDCGNWNSPSTAASSLRRMENHIPS